MLKNTIEITTQTLLYEVSARLPQGYRFVTVTCLDAGEHHEIFYHFDKNYELLNLRLELPKGHELPSISHIYFAAVLVENELQDLFGIKVTGLVVDYGGKLLLTEDAPQAPLNKTRSADAAVKVVATRDNGATGEPRPPSAEVSAGKPAVSGPEGEGK